MAQKDALFQAAREARRRAHAPYSRFAVGAAIRSTSGAIYAGCNVENASFPEGWCAETSAIAAMVLAGERRIAEVCVIADGPTLVTPCGGCRQRIAEFGTPRTRIHSADCRGIQRTFTLAEILPASFVLEGSG